MAAGWVKSLQCKSRAYEDVVTSTSCRSSYLNLKDVVIVDKRKPKPKPKPVRPEPFTSRVKRSQSVNPKSKQKQEDKTPSSDRVRRTVSAPLAKGYGPIAGLVGNVPFFPSVEELEEGHPSRNVVEIIFQTRWGPDRFPGRVEMVFKIQEPARVVARFEEYRDLIKSRVGSGLSSGSAARCIADGNEMMRFSMMDVSDGGKSTGMRTYSGSGAAHESAGGGKGRRAMVVCRVIAGRVMKHLGEPVEGKSDVFTHLGEFDSVSGEKGELLVLDSRAILPCFLVIYKL